MVHAKKRGRKEKLFFLGSRPLRCQRLLDYYPGGYKKGGGSFFGLWLFFRLGGNEFMPISFFLFSPRPPSDDCAAAAAFFAIEAAFFSPFFSPIHPHHGLPKGEKNPWEKPVRLFFLSSLRSRSINSLPSFLLLLSPPKPGEGFI